MFEVSEIFKSGWGKLGDDEKCDMIKSTGIAMNRARKAMNRASERECSCTAPRRGKGGGIRTTVTAKAQIATEDYLKLMAQLKYMINSM